MTTTEHSGVSRRTLLTRGAAGAGGIVLGGSLGGLFGPSGAALARTPSGRHDQVGYGALIGDPQGILSLPRGFAYTIVAQAGVTTLVSGEPTPSDADGTAAFVRRGGGSVLVNNHEINGPEPFHVPHAAGLVYDASAPGGTTTIEVDRRGRRVREYVSLAGTSTNCAGGRTPWGTWLSCEETEEVRDLPHGYVFEVDPHDVRANRDPRPIKALGRFAHESVAVEPGGRRIYLTEDANTPNGLLYRFTSPERLRRRTLRRLADDAGALEALQAYDGSGRLVPDLSVATRPGTRYRAKWVPVPDRDASTTSVRKQFSDTEITRSHKLEGMWWGDGGAYFTASFARAEDSPAPHDGQVWFIDPRRGTIELKLWFAYTPQDQDNDPDGPDNITVSAYGGVIMAEDGEGTQHLIGATERGETFFFARNDAEGDSEFTGPNFSPDRRTLFANVQTPGTTFAITGPFRAQR